MTSRATLHPVTALIGRDGRLIRADEPLLRLQVAAGGHSGGPLALPGLAALVRLSLRLQVPLSRPVELARDEADISLWVQLDPADDGVHLTILDWQERNSRHALTGTAGANALSGWENGPGWSWQVDAHLRFAGIEVDLERLDHAPPQIGDAMLAYFVLEGEDAGGRTGMPLVEALALRERFVDQVAHLRAMPAVRYRLSGTPLVDQGGAFIGLRGRAVRFEPSDTAAEPRPQAAAPAPQESSANQMFGSTLEQRLDQALRLPLDRIIANATTIGNRQRGPLRHDYANYATDIEAAGRHLLALVDDLADLQAIERPDFRPAREQVDLAELARRAAGLLQMRAEGQGVRIQAPAVGEKVFAEAEYRRVLQILVNLVGNAVRHSPSGSDIWVRVDEEGGRAKAIVADQGNGIDPADHDRIFERFERLGNQDGEGSGLGLYISRRLARAMGGDVTLDSALGSGARFMLDLPAWPAGRSNNPSG